MLNNAVEILGFINFMAVIILFANLDPENTPKVVQKVFNIYWLIIPCALILGIVSAMGRINGELESVAVFLLGIVSLASTCLIIIKLYPNFRKINNNAKVSFIVVDTTLVLYLGVLAVNIFTHV